MSINHKASLRSLYKKKVQTYLSLSKIKNQENCLNKEKSSKVVDNLRCLSLPKVKMIGGYKSLAEEPCLDSFYQNRLVSFPVLESESMTFYQPLSMQSLRNNAFSVLEPDPKESQKIALKDLEILLIPACVFDRDGGRIGRGKAYYDRFLAKSSALKIGVAWSCQLHASPLPLESHDIPVDIIVTDEFICFPSSLKEKKFHKIFSDPNRENTSFFQGALSLIKEF